MRLHALLWLSCQARFARVEALSISKARSATGLPNFSSSTDGPLQGLHFDTCARESCGKYMVGNPCQCNTKCEKYKNCCADRESICNLLMPGDSGDELGWRKEQQRWHV